ncbi:hypothetical protein [Kitasatospora sp. NPDC059673]|uniref:hypothetical protein n=1 Tax=Kitasatospora sp. NPDC059673 TaxID=3346901 RepID=UPI003689453C
MFGDPGQGTVSTTTLRTADSTSSTFHLGHIDQSYPDLLLTGLGCIEAHASVVVANGGVTANGSTKCLPKS